MQNSPLKIVFILANVEKAMAFEWITKALESKDFEISYILLGRKRSSPLSTFLAEQGVSAHHISLKGKGDWLKVGVRLWKLLKRIKPDIVHTHLLEASLLGLAAARLNGVKKRIHTRHHSTFHHRYFPRSVKIDKLINWLSTDIVAISPNVKQVLIEKEGVNDSKISLIPHGFDLESFQNPDPDRISSLRKKLGLEDDQIVIGCIARYFELKGIQYLIPAIEKLRKEFPKTHLILFNAKGPYKSRITSLMSGWDKSGFTEVEFEDDLFSIYPLIDIYVHIPVDAEIEAFGQTYVEAMAASKASVFTHSGIATEFAVHEENALVVPYEDSEAVYLALKRLLTDRNLKEKIENNAFKSVQEYGLEPFIHRLKKALFIGLDHLIWCL